MENMTTPKNYIENLGTQEKDENKIDIYQKITNMRDMGNLSGAFFIARQLSAEGNDMGTKLVKEIMEEMTDEN